MNALESTRNRESLFSDREILQKYLIFWRNAKLTGLKAVAAVVLLPCFFELAMAVPVEVVPENLGSFAVALIRAKKELANFETVGNRTLQSGKFGSEGRSELASSGEEAISFLSGSVPAVDKVSNQQPSADRDSGGDYWYWYVVFPISTWLLWWSTGLFGNRSDRWIGHDGKPN